MSTKKSSFSGIFLTDLAAFIQFGPG